MVKVIERKPRKITCPNCKAKLEYEFEDIQEGMESDYLGEETFFKYIICPDCDQHIKL